jgi:hypothetical protein
MHSAGARVVREDDNQMSREAVLLQWERKIEAAERLDAGERVEAGSGRFVRSDEKAPAPDTGGEVSEPVSLRPSEDAPAPRRFQRTVQPAAPQPAAERRTITITGQPTPAPRRRAVMDSQLAQPDRIALWAFLLGLLLVAVAAGTAHA